MGYTKNYYKTRDEWRYQVGSGSVDVSALNIRTISNNVIASMLSVEPTPLGFKMSTSTPPSQNTTTSGNYWQFVDTYIQLGTGNATESVDDYALDAPSTAYNISSASTSTAIDSTLGAFVRTITAVITPTATFTAKEVGMFTKLVTAVSGGTYTMSPAVLMYRKVLDTPIEFVSGVAKTIEIKIVYDAPSA